MRLLFRRDRESGTEECWLVETADPAAARLGSDPEYGDGPGELRDLAWRPMADLADDVQVSRVLAALGRRRRAAPNSG